MAGRYGLSFERVLRHLWKSRRVNRRLRLSAVLCMDDLIHAAACINDNPLAWSDMAERHERALARRCRGDQSEVAAILAVRRMLSDLRRQSGADGPPATSNLRGYCGNKPLRIWLADRLSAITARQAVEQSSRCVPPIRIWRQYSGSRPLRFCAVPDSIAG